MVFAYDCELPFDPSHAVALAADVSDCALVADGKMSEDVYKQLVETLGREKRKLEEVPLYELKYRAYTVMATHIPGEDEEVNGVHLDEDNHVKTMIVTTKAYFDSGHYHDNYHKVFRLNEIAVW